MLESVLLRRVVAREGPQKKELAPGGHQEQGESRVTEFRAPDLEKTSGAEVAKRTAAAPFGEEYQRRHVNAT